mgnify:CR=1 FL=1
MYPSEYEVNNGIKKIYFKNELPYCRNLVTNDEIMFHNLQFQGSAKHLVKDYTRGI